VNLRKSYLQSTP